MKIAYLFPGYGSQYVGMAKELYDEYRVMQEYFEEAGQCLDTNFVKLCFASSDIELSRSYNAYTSLFVIASGLNALLADKGIRPTAVCGFGQAEVNALYAAQSFSFPDGLYLLSKYASFYEQLLADHSYSAINIKNIQAQKIEMWCKKATKLEQGVVAPALYYSDTDVVISGPTIAVDVVRKVGYEEGATVEDVSIEIGLHNENMSPVMNQLRLYREKVDFKDVECDFIKGVDGEKIKDGSIIRDYIVDSLGMSIRWDAVLDTLHLYDLVIQMGPGTLIHEVQRKYETKQILALTKKTDLEELDRILGKIF